MLSSEPSVESSKDALVVLGGNHKANTVPGGHNGRIDHFYCQESALRSACVAYREAIKSGMPAHFFSTIDHIGGVRVLTGKRGNSSILSITDLKPAIALPIKRILSEEEVDDLALRFIPEKTLIAHNDLLHQENLFNEHAAQTTCSPGGGLVCRGLAGAYLDLAARESLKSGPIGNLVVFIEEGPAVPTRTIYTSGASIVRHGLLEKEGYPNWTKSTSIRGFLCKGARQEAIF